MHVSIAAIAVYLGSYLLTYPANGWGWIPSGKVVDSISVGPESELIPWDVPGVCTGLSGYGSIS